MSLLTDDEAAALVGKVVASVEFEEGGMELEIVITFTDGSILWAGCPVAYELPDA